MFKCKIFVLFGFQIFELIICQHKKWHSDAIKLLTSDLVVCKSWHRLNTITYTAREDKNTWRISKWHFILECSWKSRHSKENSLSEIHNWNFLSEGKYQYLHTKKLPPPSRYWFFNCILYIDALVGIIKCSNECTRCYLLGG